MNRLFKVTLLSLILVVLSTQVFSEDIAVNSCSTKSSKYALAKKLVAAGLVVNIKEARRVVDINCNKKRHS